jgi:hypothetical protein
VTLWGQRLYFSDMCSGAAAAVRATTRNAVIEVKHEDTITPITVSSKETESWVQCSFFFNWSGEVICSFRGSSDLFDYFTVFLAPPVCSRSQLSGCRQLTVGDEWVHLTISTNWQSIDWFAQAWNGFSIDTNGFGLCMFVGLGALFCLSFPFTKMRITLVQQVYVFEPFLAGKLRSQRVKD